MPLKDLMPTLSGERQYRRVRAQFEAHLSVEGEAAVWSLDLVQGGRSPHELFSGIVLIGLVKSVTISSKSAET